ncbi:AIPR family protein [Nocardia sp. MDA0666]|uniref:AIPR family protein n=1 Tax=Nocardia sp. MDA0666 TaxID=2135448 RepID=UPI00130490CD|nr:AIPR family protein [Nocardia sp. MDA0666]
MANAVARQDANHPGGIVSSTSSPDWLNAFRTMQDDHSLTDDAIGVFAINLRFGVDDIQSVATEAITGGGDDKKCDVLYVDKELQAAVIAQCYVSQKPRAQAPANKASDLNTALTWLLGTELERLPVSLRGRADELRSAISGGEIKQFYIWYVHNLPTSNNVNNELRAVEGTAKALLSKFESSREINIFAEEIGDSQFERLYAQAERTVIVTDTFQVTVPGTVEIVQSDWKSLVTTVSGAWLHELYSTYRTDLFSANLRGYLGSRESDSNINNGIKKTALEQPKNFYVFNNGITALVLDYKISRKARGSQSVTITGISIVNGAQTTGSIGSLPTAPPPDLQIPIRFVKAASDAIIANVVRFNNSQNRIQAADFRSTDQIQQRLRIQFESIPDAEYEGGRRGGASDAIRRSRFTVPSYTVGQSLAAFHGDPVTAYDKKSEIWTDESKYRRIFTDRTSARHVVFCYGLLSAINERKLDLTRKQRQDPSSLTEEEVSSLEFLNNKGSNYLLVYVISQCIEAIVGKPIPNRFDLEFKDNLSPAAAGDLWTPIITLVLALSNQLADAFSKNRISNESVARAVPTFVGVFNSLKTLYKNTFDTFAEQVNI